MLYSILSQQFLLGIVALFVTYTVGKTIILFYEIKGGFFFRLLLTFTIGITSIVLLYTLIKTHGRTAHIVLIPIIGYLIYYYKASFTRKPSIYYKNIAKELLWSFISFVLLFLYQSYFFFDFPQGIVKTLFYDTYNYGLTIDSLQLWGQETRNELHFFIDKQFTGCSPYHYSELWFASFFSQIFHNSALNTYQLISQPLLISISIIGIASFIEVTKWNKFYLILLALPLLFVVGDFERQTWSIVCVQGQKMAFVYIYVLLGFYLIVNKNWFVGCLILMCTIIFSITMLPAIVGGFILFFTCKIIHKKGKITKETWLLLGFLFLIVLLIQLFYTVNHSTASSKYTHSTFVNSHLFKGLSSNYSMVLNGKIIIGNFIAYTIPRVFMLLKQYLFAYIIILLLLARAIEKNLTIVFLVLCFLVAGSFTGVLVKESTFEFWQFSDIVTIVISCLFVVLIAEILVMDHTYKYVYICFVYLVILFSIPTIIAKNNVHDTIPISEETTFTKNIIPVIDSDTCKILAFMNIKKNFAIGNQLYFGHWNTKSVLYSIQQYSNKYFFYTIGNPEQCILPRGLINAQDSLSYFEFTPLNIWRSQGKGHNLQNFITHFKITYFYFEDGIAIPDFIATRIDTLLESPLHNKFVRIK